MRLCTVVFTLWLSKVAVGVANLCDMALIKGIPFAEIEFNEGILKCKDSKNILIDSILYDQLKCDDQQGIWFHGLAPMSPRRKANEDLFIKCEAKECGMSYIKGVTPAEIEFIGGKLICKDNKRIKLDHWNFFDELTCDVQRGWMDGDRQIGNSKNDLNITCKAKTCDKSYIKGIIFDQDVTYNKNILRCKNSDQNIEFRTKESRIELFTSLKCLELGWYNINNIFLESSDNEIHIKCATRACHKSLIRYIDYDYYEKLKPYDDAIKTLECREPFEIISYKLYAKNEKPEIANSLICDPSDKWKADGHKQTTISAKDKIFVKCEVMACHKDLIDGTADKSEQYKLKCDSNKVLQILGDSNFYKTLICSDGKWFDPSDTEVKVKSDVEKFTINCIPEPCTYQAEDVRMVNKITFDASTRQISCHPGVIMLGEKSHISLTCNSLTGWAEERGLVVAPADTILVVTCKHFCTASADVEYRVSSDGSYDVSCKGFTIMTYDDNNFKKETKDLTCSKADGWKADNVYIGKSSELQFQQLECNKACDRQQKQRNRDDLDSSNNGIMGIPSKWEDGLTDLAQKISKETRKVQFECKNNQLNDPEYVIKLNDKFVNSYISCDVEGYTDNNGYKLAGALDTVKIACVKTCNKHKKQNDQDPKKWEDGLSILVEKIPKGSKKVQFECVNKNFGDKNSVIELNGRVMNSHVQCDVNGYTDIHGTKLAGAFDEVKIRCVDSLCEIPSEKFLCDSMDDVPEYECQNPLFAQINDPYQLKCNANINNQRIYDAAAKKFLEDKPVMCKEKNHFYFFGDANQEKISNINHLLCVKQRCSNCKKLGNRRAGTGDDNYTPGSPDQCITDKCPNNLWKVMKKDTLIEEEYVGEVICSSSPKYNGVWLIDADLDNPISIVEGYCIASVDICIVSLKLVTNCEYNWEFGPARCKRVNPSLYRSGYITCDYKKKIFFKHRGASFFEEAEDIECDNTKGVWIVKKKEGSDELRKGGHVICADSNPVPQTFSSSFSSTLSSEDLSSKANAHATSPIIGLSIVGALLHN